MIWAEIAANSGPLMTWVWQNRDRFEPMLSRMGDYVGQFLADPQSIVHRVGSSILWGTPDTGYRILGFLEQTTPRIEAIQQAVGDLRIGQESVLSGQHALGASLSSLQTLSMVSLGLTALSPIVLHVQFRALRKRLTEIQKTLTELSKRFDVRNVAILEAGLEHFQLGVQALDLKRPIDACDRFNSSLERCLDSAYEAGQFAEPTVDYLLPKMFEVRDYIGFLKQAYRFNAYPRMKTEIDATFQWHIDKKRNDA